MSDEQTTVTPESEASGKGHIHDMGILDLRSAKTPEDLAGITELSDLGCVLIPEHLAIALARIPMHDVGAVVPIPPDSNVKVQVGQITTTGDALAAGKEDEILLIVGQLFLTTPVTSIGYKEIRGTGQVFAVRGSEAALGSKLGSFNGQTFYLPENPRILMGDTEVGKEFLELLPQPEPLVIMGVLKFQDDVTVELLKSKVPEIVLMGVIHAPRPILPLVQVLTRMKMGEIKAAE